MPPTWKQTLSASREHTHTHTHTHTHHIISYHNDSLAQRSQITYSDRSTRRSSTHTRTHTHTHYCWVMSLVSVVHQKWLLTIFLLPQWCSPAHTVPSVCPVWPSSNIHLKLLVIVLYSTKQCALKCTASVSCSFTSLVSCYSADQQLAAVMCKEI